MSLSMGVRTLLKATAQCSLFCRHSSHVIGLRQWVRANSMQVLRLQRPAPLVLHRHQSDTSAQNTTDGERRVITKLQQTFPKAAEIRVHDISGGCGSMFEVHIVSEEFRDVRTVLQHRMVNEALKDEIKNMHGLRISTSEPDV